MGESAMLQPGQWVVATGHPGGYQKGRSPVVRLGRIVESNKNVIRSDCTLVGGDSGGPLFDMQGKVVGINSRIGGSLNTNFHVPVDTFTRTWERLAEGKEWGGTLGSSALTWLGTEVDKNPNECKVQRIYQKSPAEKAGLKPNDIIVKFDGKKIEAADDLQVLLKRKKPGDEVTIEVMRDGAPLSLKATLTDSN
jgi:serine protease Do